MKCNKAGVPLYSVAAVSLISCLAFLVANNSAVEVFFWFVDLTTTALVLTYTMMLITFVGFYRARRAQGLDPSMLPYTAPLAPYSAYLGIGLGCLMLLFVGYDAFSPFGTRSFITAYFADFFAIFMFLAWKILKRSKFVKPAEADLVSGKAEVDEECRHWEEDGFKEVEEQRLAKMNLVHCLWERIW